MKLFGATETPALGAIIDIGSASVLVAFVLSRPDKQAPDIIWSHREHVAMRSQSSLTQGAKNVMTALMNALILLDSTGRKVVTQVTKQRDPSHLYVTIAAPWVYTVSKTITYSKDQPFTITDDLVHELERAAQQKIDEELKENEVVTDLGLHVVSRVTLEMLANGYPITSAQGQEAHSLQLARGSAVAQRYLTAAIEDFREKSMPKTILAQNSFMLAYHDVVRALYPQVSECCLVDITFEATEIGIVRDGVLRYCTHTPYGAFTLAREIAEAEKISPDEAYGYLTNSAFLSEESSARGATAREALYTHYEDKVRELLRETGDDLTIPKTLIVRTRIEAEVFFLTRIMAAAGSVTRGSHLGLHASSDLVAAYYKDEQAQDLRKQSDSGMVVAAQFFHNNHAHSHFEWQ